MLDTKDELLLWTPTHRHTHADQPAQTYIYQLKANTEFYIEDLPKAMADWDEELVSWLGTWSTSMRGCQQDRAFFVTAVHVSFRAWLPSIKWPCVKSYLVGRLDEYIYSVSMVMTAELDKKLQIKIVVY